MDSFAGLPPEIRSQIIVDLESGYAADRRFIARGILRGLLEVDASGIILQDAMAILHFPNRPSNGSQFLRR
ncbi:hypothetical protein F53441_3087 [Fusarium austroafricanum]|uniref:Uncharacterized protein n=1 Tax=Fusarium austroafricanum TaxID=2364996 RepID=A0A8H4KQG1_9HYPO|nr:hypothetical protein F53441_3087 [Fusarium austroafricanum]